MAVRKQQAKSLIAISSFHCTVGKGKDAREHFVREGDVLPSDHPAVQGREELFAEQAEA